MKELFILRHSKAGQTNKKITDDHERPLTEKGIDACREVGQYMLENGFIPQKIITSSAVRTMETSQIIRTALNDDTIDVELEPRLYLASIRNLFAISAGLDDTLDKALIVGHNPGLYQFCLEIAGKGEKQLYRSMRSQFPPASLAIFQLEILHWHEILPQTGNLVSFITPRTLSTVATS